MKTIYALIAVISLIMATATADSAFNQILWSGSMLLVTWLSGKAFVKRMSEEEKEERA